MRTTIEVTINPQENCWFFASLIQEISVQFLGGRFLPGEHPNHLWMSHGRRKAIKTTMYTMVPTDVQALVKDLDSLVLMTSDTSLHSSTTRLTRILETQDVGDFMLIVQKPRLTITPEIIALLSSEGRAA